MTLPELIIWPLFSWSSLFSFLFLAYTVSIMYQNHRRPNEPAIVFSFILNLGSAISFGSDPLTFLRDNAKTLGSTFCAVIAGNRTVFINDPEDWKGILRLPKVSGEVRD